MTYVICEPCIGENNGACVDACPVDCIYGDEDGGQRYINPDECIDCGACDPVCPVTAIFPGELVPEKWRDYIQKNADYCGG